MHIKKYLFKFIVLFFTMSFVLPKGISLKHTNGLHNTLEISDISKQKIIESIAMKEFSLSSTLYQLK